MTTYKKDGGKWLIGEGNIKSPGGFLLRNYKIDIWLQPDYRAIYGNLNKAVEAKAGLLVSTKVQILRGLTFYSGLHIPLINDIDQQPLSLRWAPSYLDYFMKIGKSGYAQLSSGLFFQDRYGFKVVFLNYPLDKSWSYGMESSFSGYYYFYPKSFKYTGLREFSFLANVAYRFKNHDLTLKLSGGQFLHSDRGVRADLIRQFKRAEIGLFGISSGNGATIGVDVAFRIWPGTLVQNKRMRLRTAEDFPFQYLYSRGFKIGEVFKTYTDLSRRLRQQHVYYWNDN
ncbi:MAG: YjbH domain-containing protein [Cytophagales bacterium]|nr:YjbH domain-containing protein [Cytophagales bacterium]